MKKRLDILKWLAPLFVLLLANACGHDDLVPDEVYVEETVPYVELRIAVPTVNPSATRANPMGGEEGNGRERGILHEDDIHDINVFFYVEETKTVTVTDGESTTVKDVGLGMDSDGDQTTIVKHIYYNLDNKNDTQNSQLWIPDDKPQDYDDTKYDPYYEKGYVILKFQCKEEDLQRIDQNGGLNFVAVANAGPIDDMEGGKLGDLRENILKYYFGTNTWTTTIDAFSHNAANMDYFLMSTAYNENTNYGGQYTGDNKVRKQSNGEYKGVTTLQRMYARLDLWYNKADNAVTEGTGTDEKVNELKYVVDGATDNSVYLTNVLPVNVMQTPSYLFKKVVALPEGTNSWNATSNSSVWDSGKTIWSGDVCNWGGKETPDNGPFDYSEGSKLSKDSDLPMNYVLERHTAEKQKGGATSEANLTTWYGNTRVSKVRTDIQSDVNGKLTGYWHGLPNSASDPSYGCNYISIIGYANENTHPTDCYHSNYLTGMAFRAIYVPAEIYSGYRETVASGKTVIEASPWNVNDGTPTKIYRYSPTTKLQSEAKSLYFTKREAALKYAEGHPEDMAIISSEAEAFTATKHGDKWGFVCYYNLWLRHYNFEQDDPQASYPMEYATVRNNIYRVSVSFGGPGDPSPTMREPDTMKARIFVRKWNYKEEPLITF